MRFSRKDLFNSVCNILCYLTLYREDVTDIPVKGFRQQLPVVPGINQFNRNPCHIFISLCASFKYKADPKFISQFRDWEHIVPEML